MNNFHELPLTLDALRVLDSIDRRGSFAAAAEELHRVPSALSYAVQKLEQELDVALFDRSGHRARLTAAGRLLLERGRTLLIAADQLVADTRTLAQGWEPELTLVVDEAVAPEQLFGLVEPLAEQTGTRLKLLSAALSGTWEWLEEGRADLIVAARVGGRVDPRIKVIPLVQETMLYVAAPHHPIHLEAQPLAQATLQRYRAIAVADSARHKPPRSFRLLERQPRLTVSTMAAKIEALRQGLGIGTAPLGRIRPLLERGELVVFAPEYRELAELVMAWDRAAMGKAKSWCIKAVARLFQPPAGVGS